MPLVLDIQKPHFQLKVWKIEESLAFFEENTNLYESEKARYLKIKREYRKLQWIAGSYLTKQMIGDEEIVKNEHGKPFIKSKSAFISVSHCADYAVCIVSEQYNVGVDIEPMREKVLRLTDKFLNEEEIIFLENDNKIKHAITCWAMKEAAFKWYGKEYLSFKDNILIAPFKYKDELSRIRVCVVAPHKNYLLKAFHLNINEHSLVFCFAKKDLQKPDLLGNLDR
ncbi:MAG: 4'-phosphopantetheinyl transferase family protein [Chitinophagales bacterium]